MKYKVIVYYDNMKDSEHIFNNKNDAINEMHRLKLKYRNARKYKVEMMEVQQMEIKAIKKPVVPQFVADWYEKYKFNLNSDIFHLIRFWDTEDRNSDFCHWFDDTKNNSIQTLVNMHQFGYEVEEEKRYTVKLKNKAGKEDSLVKTNTNGFRFYSNIYTDNRAHTRKELEEAGFDWVFDCPGVEVKEVTDE